MNIKELEQGSLVVLLVGCAAADRVTYFEGVLWRNPCEHACQAHGVPKKRTQICAEGILKAFPAWGNF
eukprot:s963_g1.t1